MLQAPDICSHEQAIEFQLGIVFFPAIFRCPACLEFLTCKCFSGRYSLENDVHRNCLPHHPRPEKLIEQRGLCCFCTGKITNFNYGNSLYYSKFLQRYLPYHELLLRTHERPISTFDPEYKLEEKALKEIFGYTRHGGRWISERILVLTVQSLFPKVRLITNYRGKELEGLELDIWIPEVRVGIEYQGQQHYKQVRPWGGEEGLKKRRALDRKKKKICKSLGYELLFFNHHDELTRNEVMQKISRIITPEKLTLLQRANDAKLSVRRECELCLTFVGK